MRVRRPRGRSPRPSARTARPRVRRGAEHRHRVAICGGQAGATSRSRGRTGPAQGRRHRAPDASSCGRQAGDQDDPHRFRGVERSSGSRTRRQPGAAGRKHHGIVQRPCRDSAARRLRSSRRSCRGSRVSRPLESDNPLRARISSEGAELEAAQRLRREAPPHRGPRARRVERRLRGMSPGARRRALLAPRDLF